MSRKARAALAAAAILALILAACGGQTTGATGVDHDSATLTAEGHCDAGDDGRIFWDYRPAGAGSWTRVYEAGIVTCSQRQPASGEGPLDETVNGLQAGTAYEYRVGFDFTNGGDPWVDSQGATNGTDYDTFTTTADGCTVTLPSGSSFSSVAAADPGDEVCLSAGSYSWGDYNPPAGVTIRGLGPSVTVTGEARVGANNVTLENLHLRPAASETHAVLYVNGTAANFTGRRLDVSADHIDFVMPFLSSGTPTGITLVDSKFHAAFGAGCFSPGTGSRTHAIYYSAGTNGRLERLWLTDYTGYGLHFYGPGSVDGTHVEQVVSDSRSDCDTNDGLGNVKDTGGADAITVNRSITEGGNWKCLDGGVTVSNSRMSGSMSSCTDGGGNATGVNTTFNSATDLRIPGNPDFQWVPGPQ